jgi:predicted ATPase/class 3 adenylate cyclase
VTLPTGTVTFLFTDLEGSSRLWEAHPDAMRDALARHDELLREAIEAHDGYVIKTDGDGCMAAFATADAGVSAALAGQIALRNTDWGGTGPLWVRMGLHTGVASRRDGDYFGPTLNRAARLKSVAHGGQIVCSLATADLARDVVGERVTFLDLGEHRLRDLARAERVFQVTVAGLQRDFPPLASVDAYPGNLPLQVSSFIGRVPEMARVATALGEARIVTITGAGGVGKTRLAVQVAADLMPGFREGAWLIELAPVRDLEGVDGAFAAVFAVTARAGLTLGESVIDLLRTKQLLLVVDNCEHVLDPAAELIADICHACPNVSVLATSREGFALDGERVVPLPSLSAPPPDADVDAAAQTDAVHLFVERANGVDPDFALTPANVAAVAQVCRRLDGVALAIELAAARVTSMSPAELATALDHRFDVLAGGRRGAVKRQQTLRATIDWSYDLLDEPRQRLLARLSVFAGGCTRAAAEAICTGRPVEAHTVYQLLAGLVDRSLVVAERGGLDTRYRLSETIREYSEERLAERSETADLRDRHARYYAHYLRRLVDAMDGPGQIDAAKRAAADGDNLITAQAYAIGQRDLDLVSALFDAAPAPGLQTGLELRISAEPVLALPGVAEHSGYPLFLVLAGGEAQRRGELDLALERYDAADAADQALTAPPPYGTLVAAMICGGRGMVGIARGAWDVSAEAWLESANVLRRVGNVSSEATATASAAAALSMGGRQAEARARASQALALARSTGSPASIASGLYAVALATGDDDPAGARAALDEAFDLMIALDYENFAVLTGVAFAATAIRDWLLTARAAARLIRLLHWINDLLSLSAAFVVTARALAETDPEGAATVQSAARPLAASLATDSATASGSMPDQQVGRFIAANRETSRLVTDALGDDRVRVLRAHGAAMDSDQAVAYTLARLDAFMRAHSQATE